MYSVVAICFVAWLFIILRISLYEMSDGGSAIILRAATSLSGCIAVCGLCKGIFSSKMGGGTLAWVGEHSLEVYLTHYLLLSLIKSDKVPILYSPVGLSLVLVNYVITVALTVMAIVMMNQNAVRRFVLFGWGKEKVSDFFLWAGKQSLEIYMMHGLLLNIFKSSVAIQFSSIEGYLLTAGNFALTIGLCAVVIRLLNQNAVLKKVLNIR